VIVPITRRAYDLDVPIQAAPLERESDEAQRQIVLEICAVGCPSTPELPEIGLPPDCRVRLADVEVEVAGLANAIERIYAARAGSDRVLFLAAEDDLEYELVLRIVDAARTRVPDLAIGLASVEGPPPSMLISNAAITGAAEWEIP
jgi:hypothetical protein